jgi:TPP-dependent 2-oxoacid decarboxylase
VVVLRLAWTTFAAPPQMHVLGRLKDIGVTDIFGVPDDFAFPVEDAIVAHPDINWIGACNELKAEHLPSST